MHQRISCIWKIQRLILPTMHPALIQSKTTVPSTLSHVSSWRAVDRHIFRFPSKTICSLQICRAFSSTGVVNTNSTFDEGILDIVVCPLTKKPLRYDKDKNELVNDDIGVAYPIEDGIPNLVPQDARMINDDKHSDKGTTENDSVKKT